MPILSVLLLAAASAFSSAQSDDLPDVPTEAWPVYQYASDHNAVFRSSLDVEWGCDLGDRTNGGLALVGSTLYADSFDHRAYAIDVRTGHIRWAKPGTNVLMSTPVVARHVVVFGSGSNAVLKDEGKTTVWGVPGGDYIFGLHTHDGRLVWSYHTVGEDMPSAALTHGLAISANGDMHAYAVDAETGRLAWRVPIPGISTMASTAIDGDRVFIVAALGTDYNYSMSRTHLLALDAATGKTIWSAPYGGSDSAPTLGDGMVFIEGAHYARKTAHGKSVPMGRNAVYAVDENTGKLRWSYEGDDGYFTWIGSSEETIAGTYHDGTLYQSFPTVDHVIAFDAKTGRQRWRFTTNGQVKMSPVVVDGIVIFGDTSGALYSVDAQTGHIVHVERFNAPFSTSPPIVVGSTVIVAYGKRIVAIRLKTLES
jgi:outer membrane protein assembly factor BamB